MQLLMILCAGAVFVAAAFSHPRQDFSLEKVDRVKFYVRAVYQSWREKIWALQTGSSDSLSEALVRGDVRTVRTVLLLSLIHI